MGHYDTCREENCGICGQLIGYCEHTAETCRDCEGSGEILVKRDRQGNIDYLSGQVINNETTVCRRCKGEGYEANC